jgi:hypothetical protein
MTTQKNEDVAEAPIQPEEEIDRLPVVVLNRLIGTYENMDLIDDMGAVFYGYEPISDLASILGKGDLEVAFDIEGPDGERISYLCVNQPMPEISLVKSTVDATEYEKKRMESEGQKYDMVQLLGHLPIYYPDHLLPKKPAG